MQPAKSVFEKVPQAASFPAIEHKILELWQQLNAFHESNRRREGSPQFVFYDGPPFATGTPHYGHLLQSTIKDIVPRYWNMRGHQVERRFGWDCHGLPIENLAQQALNVKGPGEIRELGVDKFNEQCRSMVLTYVEEWRRTVTRLGRWVDFDNDYKTMDPGFMESVWWVFKRLWDQGRIYKAHRIMPYDPALATPLSKLEAGENYKDVQDPAITVKFRVKQLAETSKLKAESAKLFLLAWTTTPWTLPENLALCVGPDIEYVFARDAGNGDVYVIAKERLSAHYKKPEQYEVLGTIAGKDLIGTTYEPIFPYFADQPKAFRVLADAFVSTGDGTGIVHMAPAYGEDDYRVCRREGIGLVDPLDEECKFTAELPEYAGQFCKDADKALIKRLKDEGKIVQQSTIVHPYPFGDRSDAPLIYRAIDAWYMRVEDMRNRLLEVNAGIGWVPENIGAGRFANLLKDSPDWNLSRNRFWGSCIPIWVNAADANDMICVGSIAELAQLSGVTVTDLHKHHVDGVVIRKDGKTYRRTPEVLDCWFESGAMPYGQQHYPFERKEAFERNFPAHFIGEAIDQTRGWFNRLLLLSTALFDCSSFKNVIVTGHIMAEDGKKLSKRHKNYPDPNAILDQFGADALRTFLINSPVVRGDGVRFSEDGLREIVRTVVLPYWNALSFFATYASVDGFDPRAWQASPIAQRAELDRWILSVLQSLIRDVNREMEAYRLYNVVPRLLSFIDDLTNWYIRLSRRRFWKSEDDADKTNAYATLYSVLVDFAKVLAPFMPFLTEEVYQRLVRPVSPQAPASVHWCDYPQVDQSVIDRALEERIAVAHDVVALGRKLREDQKIKVRQPLGKLTVVSRDAKVRDSAMQIAALISDELNLKAVETSDNEAAFTSLSVKPNFQALRQRCGPKLKDIGAALSKWSFGEVATLESGHTISVCDEAIGINDVLLTRTPTPGAAVASEGAVTVVLDTKLTPELVSEGMAREFISVLQQARKAAGLEVSDRIRVQWHSDDSDVQAAIRAHRDEIAAEILAVEFTESNSPLPTTADLNGRTISYSLAKA